MARKNKEQTQQPQQFYPSTAEEIKARMWELNAQLAAINTTPHVVTPPPINYGFEEQPRMQQQPQMPIPPPQPNYQQSQQPPHNNGNEPLISVKLAAREVWRWLKIGKLQLMLGIAAPWIVALCSMFNPIVGAVSAAGASGIMIFALFKSQNEMRRLEQKYNIDPKTGQ